MTDASQRERSASVDWTAVVASSSLGNGLRRLSGWTRESRLYQWLTADPEPTVIVIDLRETSTVGVFVRLLDTVVDWVRPYWEESALRRLADRSRRLFTRAADTRVGRVVGRLLEPPALPDEKRGETAATDTDREASAGTDEETPDR